MDRLSFFIALLVFTVVSGVLIIVTMTFGWYGWVPIGIAVLLGLLSSWPVGFMISRRIKKNDPDFRRGDVKLTDGPVPDPDAPEA